MKYVIALLAVFIFVSFGIWQDGEPLRNWHGLAFFFIGVMYMSALMWREK